jgi:hypothetical protein
VNTPTLYRPTLDEITRAAQSAAHRHPQLASRIQRATVIMEVGDVELEPVAWEVRQVARWRVASQSHKGAYVVVNGHCPCDDCRRNRVAYCKHSIAVHLYTKIVTNHLNAGICSGAIEMDALPGGNLALYANRMGIVQVRFAGSAFLFTDAASMVRYSLWLAAQPVTVEWLVAQPATLAA